jgi:DNA polymerase III sliding clamp (beta) subunit (PCNA family)
MHSLSFALDRKGFNVALGHMARVVERRNTIPILSHVRLDVGRGIVRVTGTDLDMQLTIELPAAVKEGDQGALIVPLDTLKAAVGKFKGETVTISDMGSGRASLACSTTNARAFLPTMKVDEWPTIARGDILASFWAPTEAFGGAIAQALPFVSTEETRYYLKGVYIHPAREAPAAERTAEHEAAIEHLNALKTVQLNARVAARAIEEGETFVEGAELPEGFEAELQAAGDACDVFEAARMTPDVLRFATTDGHRMARVTQPLPDGAASFPDMIVPTKACTVLGKIVGKKPERLDMKVSASRTKIELQYGHATLLAKAIDGSFPDYTRVVPTMNDQSLTVPAGAFADAVDGVASIANEKTRAVAVSIDAAEGVVLTCTSPANGRSAAIFEGAEISPGTSLAIGFNAGYLTAILKSFAADADVILRLSDYASPVRIESPAKPELLIVLMPMRVDGSILTRADVEAMHLGPWERFCRAAHSYATTLANLSPERDVSDPVRKHIGEKMREAINDLVERTGQPRAIARLRMKAELGSADVCEAYNAAGDAAVQLIAAYQRQPNGSFASLGRARDLGQDPVKMDPAEDTPAEPEAAPVPETVPEYASDYAEPMPAEPETVAAVAAETKSADVAAILADAPADDPAPGWNADGTRTPVKVETVYGQVIFVDAADYADEGKAHIRRLHKSGGPFMERESKGGNWQKVLRENIARAILPRVRGDVPHPAARATPQADAVAARLAALERTVAGLAVVPVAAPPKRSDAHLRALRAYLALRASRAQLRRTEACLADANACASSLATRVDGLDRAHNEAVKRGDQLQVRCNALERLQLDSVPLDTAAPRPAIILPVSRTSARAE